VRTSGLGGFQLHTDCRETARQLDSCLGSIVHRPSQLRLPVPFHECLAVCAARPASGITAAPERSPGRY
jgi:hypothetical protein